MRGAQDIGEEAVELFSLGVLQLPDPVLLLLGGLVRKLDIQNPRVLTDELVELAVTVQKMVPGAFDLLAGGVGLGEPAGGDLPQSGLPDLHQELAVDVRDGQVVSVLGGSGLLRAVCTDGVSTGALRPAR